VIQKNNYNRKLLSDFHVLVSWPTFNTIVLLNGLNFGGSLAENVELNKFLPSLWFVFILFWLQIKTFEKVTKDNKRLESVVFYCFLHVFFLLSAIAIKRSLLGPLPHTIDMRPAVIAFINLSLQAIVLTVADYSSCLQRRNSELQLNLTSKELLSIKLRSKPHFIYNTLNLIATEIKDNPQLAEELIYDLSDILRSISHHSEKTHISLSEEIRVINKYIDIQRKRFHLNIDVTINQNCNTLNTKLPPLLILPLIENIFKHGIHHGSNANKISMSFSRIDKYELQIKILNDIDYYAPTSTSGEGSGIIPNQLEDARLST